MRRKLVYFSGTGDESVELDAFPVWVGAANDLRGRSWDYTLNYRGISGANRPAREVDLDAWVLDMAQADRMRRVFDRDVANATPGTLAACGTWNELPDGSTTYGGAWRQRAYVTASDASAIGAAFLKQRLTVVLLDGVWRREHSMKFDAEQDDGSEYAYLDYGFDFAHDFSSNPKPDSVDASEFAPSSCKIVFWGPCTNPAVTIGGNVYRVNATAPSGGYILIDGVSKAVSSVTRNGTATNVFDRAERGTGEGCGSYAFQPLPPGRSSVQWDRTFAFTLYYYDEEGEPPWSE